MQKNKYQFLQTIVIAIFAVLFASFSANSQSSLIHFWYFDGSIPNNTPLTELDATYSLVSGGANLEFQSALEGYPFDSNHPNWRKASMERRNSPTPINYRPIANSGQPYNESLMRGIQIKQPFTGDGGENIMIFHVPTTGYRDIVFMFAAIDEEAADDLVIDYSVSASETEWISDGLATTIHPLESNYLLFTVNFSEAGDDIQAANDNPDFKIRIRFQGSNMDADEGERVTFNNISLDGVPLEDTNLPPFVANPIGLQKMVEDQPATFNLLDIFSDPENDPLTFTATSNRPQLVQAQVNGNTLTLTGISRGDATITLTASDGVNAPATHSFRVLLYPQPFDMGQGDFSFTQWMNTHPDYTYPENMLFLQSDISDPGVSYDLLYPYFIPHDDYHADDQETIGFPYNNTGRTRINGLGMGGVSFVNTGRDRDLGGALVALNTSGQSQVHLSFLAGTMLRNSRIYAFRLQYRIGTEGTFNNVLINGQPVEYIAGVDGDLMSFENLVLPPALLGHENLQLLWRYYFYSGEGGPRSMLRLDDIFITRVSSVDDLNLNGLHIYSTQGNIFINNSVGESLNVQIFSITGQQLYAGTLSGEGLHRISESFAIGAYIVRVKTNQNAFSQKLIVR